jgi:hypothetical protein
LKLENVTVAADFVGNICLTASSFQYWYGYKANKSNSHSNFQKFTTKWHQSKIILMVTNCVPFKNFPYRYVNLQQTCPTVTFEMGSNMNFWGDFVTFLLIFWGKFIFRLWINFLKL